MDWTVELEAILARPRGEQAALLQSLRGRMRAVEMPEAWNTQFGAGSLFDAWTSSSLVSGLYAANRELLAKTLAPGFRAIEVGGGDGRLWRGLDPSITGELWVIDPVPGSHAQVAEAVPDGVRVHSLVGRVEQVDLPPVDAIVCSLTLHHVAGRDADERALHGLDGPGKLEVLRRMHSALRGGLLLLNEADVHCDLALAPGTDALRDHVIDSYLRRAARALLADIEGCDDADLRARLAAVVQHWCLDQLQVVEAQVADRDVYELDVAHWLELLAAAGFRSVQHRYTDAWHLFVQYQAH